MSPEIAVGVGAVAGYAVGQVAESLAQARVAKNRTNLYDLGGAEFTSEADRSNTVLDTLRSRAIAPIALVAALGGFMEGYALLATDSVQEQQSPLRMVVDHSGGTIGEGQSAPINLINSVVAEVAKAGVTSKVLVASIDDIRSVSYEQVAQDEPFGDAPLDKALGLAISENTKAPEKIDAPKITDRIVVVTNGNAIGSTNNTVKQASAAGAEITVVNVKQPGKTNEAIEASLKAIAVKTGGIYVNGNAKDTDKVIDRVKESLAPTEETVTPPYKALFGFAGAVALLTAGVAYRRRRDEPLLQRNKGE